VQWATTHGPRAGGESDRRRRPGRGRRRRHIPPDLPDRAPRRGDLLPAATVAPPAPASRFAELFQGIYRRRVLVVSALWLTAFFVNYGLTSWLPTIYTGTYGLDLDQALQLSLLSTSAGFAGSPAPASVATRPTSCGEVWVCTIRSTFSGLDPFRT
jgi:hypothetical protein